MSSARFLTLASAAVLCGFAPSTSSGQLLDRLTLTPWVGWFEPSASLGDVRGVSDGGSVYRRLQQSAGFMLGANASYWLTRRVAIELGGAYALSEATATTMVASSPIPDGMATEDAYVSFGSLKLMAHLMPEESNFNVRLGAGPAIIHRGGAAYHDGQGRFTGLTDTGAAFSLCTRIPISDRVRIRVRGESYVYRAELGFEDASNPARSYQLGAKLQNDFVLSGGLQLMIGR